MVQYGFLWFPVEKSWFWGKWMKMMMDMSTCPFLMDMSFPGCFEYVDFTVKSGCRQGKATVAGRPGGRDAAAGGLPSFPPADSRWWQPANQQRKSHHLEIISLGKSMVFVHIELLPGLVNCYITNWKDPPFFMGQLTISTGPFSIAM